MKVVARFEVPYYQYLDENSQLTEKLPTFAKDADSLAAMYRLMTLVRLFDTKAIALQRTGKLGTYPSIRGQEAVFVGVGHAMHKEDIFVPYYRDVGVVIQRGVNLSDILLYWGGDERGNCYANNKQDFPYSVPVGSQPLHASGAAVALKYHKKKAAVLTICGDGATSQGDFYEAMNVAGVWKLPVVFVVCNNQWAISVSRGAQTAAQTLAQKAIAAGIPGEQVDGNDIIAVHHRVEMALKKAREQHEPVLLEMLCYRQSDHTTADDARRYEPPKIREQEWKKEPIMRLRRYLEQIGVWSEDQEQALLAECEHNINQTVEDYLHTPPQPAESMFDYLYATLPKAYQEQRELVKKIGVVHHG
ncbi:MAG: pyruvate dehydrogenase (acetyl-transferring) E1 component subunit alpha [Gammaproteobacteria bacterium RIFCSPHIGHO2_12_FULL_41_20]|nr:MAG: pyruvate dehydrogenase (acetyl-transferring) E1 component subunit alpha [Gammaproteobacteria bacterium RIFCSPHIGHO2_12_FULL_41_20]